MKVKSLCLSLYLFSALAYGSQHQMIDTLGSSSKGQFVAVEEYGYNSGSHSYYVTIKIVNVWTKNYVGETIEVELPAHRPHVLQEARDQAKNLAHDELSKFRINI